MVSFFSAAYCFATAVSFYGRSALVVDGFVLVSVVLVAPGVVLPVAVSFLFVRRFGCSAFSVGPGVLRAPSGEVAAVHTTQRYPAIT